MLASASDRRTPEVDVTADDGVRHQMWVVDDEATIAALTRAFDALPAIYIADGHHRSAAAARVAEARGGNAGSHGYFLAVLFPHHQMTILDYNRVVRDLNGRTPGAAARRSCANASRSRRPIGRCAPRRPASSACILAGRWYRLTLRPELVPRDDPIGRLPITLLARQRARAAVRHHRPAHRQAHRLRRRRRAASAELERRVVSGEMAVGLRALSDADGRPDGGGRRRRDHAAEIDLVRAEARRRHGQPRAGLRDRRQTTRTDKETTLGRAASDLLHSCRLSIR